MNKNNHQSAQADGSSGEKMSAEEKMNCSHDDIRFVPSRGTPQTPFLVCNNCNQVQETFGKSISELRIDFPSKEFGL